MGNYKQWSHATREARYKEYLQARRTGEIAPPGACEICGQTEGTMHHAEDYGPTRQAHLDAQHSLCKRCHGMLHLRFRFPGLWAQYKERCRRDGPQPPVAHMGVVFYQPRRDVPVVIYAQGAAWWERLSTARYTGTLEPEALKPRRAKNPQLSR